MHQTQFSEKVPYGGFCQIRSQMMKKGVALSGILPVKLPSVQHAERIIDYSTSAINLVVMLGNRCKLLWTVLTQKQGNGQVHPYLRIPHSESPRKELWHHRNEIFGCSLGSKHIRPYLLEYHCTVFTDHSACLALLILQPR
jgi:hypothetical protein